MVGWRSTKDGDFVDLLHSCLPALIRLGNRRLPVPRAYLTGYLSYRAHGEDDLSYLLKRGGWHEHSAHAPA